jgi:predicted histidine transporter YuiF (NhaC family)
MRNVVDWQYVRSEVGEAVRLLGFLVVVLLAAIGFVTVLGWIGLG